MCGNEWRLATPETYLDRADTMPESVDSGSFVAKFARCEFLGSVIQIMIDD